MLVLLRFDVGQSCVVMVARLKEPNGIVCEPYVGPDQQVRRVCVPHTNHSITWTRDDVLAIWGQCDEVASPSLLTCHLHNSWQDDPKWVTKSMNSLAISKKKLYMGEKGVWMREGWGVRIQEEELVTYVFDLRLDLDVWVRAEGEVLDWLTRACITRCRLMLWWWLQTKAAVVAIVAQIMYICEHGGIIDVSRCTVWV